MARKQLQNNHITATSFSSSAISPPLTLFAWTIICDIMSSLPFPLALFLWIQVSGNRIL